MKRLPSWASARKPASYIVAIDDSGQKVVRPSKVRRCFFLGGVILPAANLDKLRRTWPVHGTEEIKARTYASEFGFEDRPTWAEGLLSVEMDHWDALPLWIAFDKNETGEDITTPTRRGGRRIDLSKAVAMLASTLAVHLKHVRGTAESVFIDRMSSEAEEEPLQEEWRNARAGLNNGLQRTLPESLAFVDSKESPEVQVADVVTGLLRGAHEERRPIAPGLSRLLRKAQEKKLFGFHLS